MWSTRIRSAPSVSSTDLGDAVAGARPPGDAGAGTPWVRCIRGAWRRPGPNWPARWWSRTWPRISVGAPPVRGSRGCMPFRSNSARRRRFTTSSGRSRAGTSWRRSTERLNWLAAARLSAVVAGHRRPVGNAGLLAAVARRAGTDACSWRRAIRWRRRGRCAEMADIGQDTRYLHVPGAGHLIHDDAPEVYREAVTGFLTALA